MGSQLLDETAPMASKSWQPSHNPPCRREEWHPSHCYNNNYNYTVETKEGGGKGNNPETTLEGRTVLQQTHEEPTHACGQQKSGDCTGLPILVQSMHWQKCLTKHCLA